MSAYLVIGVSGSGKSVVGAELAGRLGAVFLDADDYHPPGNVRKMASGEPLTDADRYPWLDNLVREVSAREQEGRSVVLACSALKKAYRDHFRRHLRHPRFIYLQGDYATIEKRMQSREGHFMKARMLRSQFDALEEPLEALTLSVDQPVEAIVAEILRRL